MSDLNNYMKDAEQHNLGKETVDTVKRKAKSKVKQKIMDITGVTALKKAAKKGLKAGAKALGQAAKQGLAALVKFLFTTPVGWVILVILIIGLIAFSLKKQADQDAAYADEAAVSLLTNDSLNEDGVAVLMSNCPETKEIKAGDIDTDAAMEEKAKMVYTIFKSYGLNDECIAGMLGNMQEESHVDSTGIEGIYDEDHQIGKRKSKAFADLNDWTVRTVFPAYAKIGTKINTNAYKASDGKYYCGLGLVQWTGPGAYEMLSVNQSTGHEWYSMEYQLAYMISDTHYRPGFFATWKENMSTNARDAAYYFTEKYEAILQVK